MTIFQTVLFWGIIAALAVYIAYKLVQIAEWFIGTFMNQIPIVNSDHVIRRAVVREIRTRYPGARTVCEIGSGYGAMARKIARRCHVSVTGIENMPICATISRTIERLTCTQCRTVWDNAFKYLATGVHFDIAVAYLGPVVNDRVISMRNAFDVLILIDVPARDVQPTHIVDIGHGYTRYGRDKYPHKLFIYDFRK